MSVDYDLVIIGSSYEGIYAAQTANNLKARVALVTQGEEYYIPNSHPIFNQSCGEITRFINQLQDNIWGIDLESMRVSQIHLEDINSWSQLVKERLQAEHSLERLAAAGVDVIFGKGEFCRLPKQAFIVGERRLRSRKFLITTGAKSIIKSIDGSDRVNCLTIDDLWQNNCLANLPHKIVIIGGSARSLELAQGLAKLNKEITLVISNTRILPQEDLKVAQLIQAQLIADGIEIFTNATVTKITEINGQKILHMGEGFAPYVRDRNLVTEAIVFTDDYEVNISGLNLEGVRVKYQTSGIIVNHKFQTTNKDIYACGDVIGGFKSSAIACYEVNIVLKTILFLPWLRKLHKHNIYLLQAILTYPNFARVGKNKTEAIRDYGQNIYIVKEYFKTISQAQISGNTTGWCQFILRSNGEIIGCTIIGDRAVELISTIAVMMQYKIKLNHNPQLGLLQMSIPYVSPSCSEILQRVATAFYRQKLQRNHKLLRRLENWFSFRRNWNI